MSKIEVKLPSTVEASVRLLQSLLPEDEQMRIAFLQAGELVTLDFGLGKWVRNHLGLWDANSPLLANTGETHPDDAAAAIIKAFWLTLKNGDPKVH